MLNISKISSTNSKYLFLGIFLSFLIFPFLILIILAYLIHLKFLITVSSRDISDKFLNSEFNCIIHTFLNHIQVEDSFQFSDQIYNNEIILKYYYHFYSSFYNLTTKQLRAPPKYLV